MTNSARPQFRLRGRRFLATATAFFIAIAGYAGEKDGDRTGIGWGADTDGWNDASSGVFPDWLQVNFNGSHVLSSVTIVTLQDNYPRPAEPDAAMTFSAFGMTAFDVQVWNGSSWTTVGSVTGNDKVMRNVTFAPVAASAIRIVCNNALSNYCRLVEVEARDDRNWAAATNGASATASSSLSAAYPVAAIIDGERKGLNWGSGGGWNDATPNAYPDWARIDFSGHQWFDQVSVYALQDNYPNPVEPTNQTTFARYGITSFEVQVWDGVNWIGMGSVRN